MKFTATTEEKKRRTGGRKSSKRGKGLIVTLLVAGFLLGSCGVFFAFREVSGMRSGQGEDITIDIPAGTYGNDVIQMLKDARVIGNATLFKLYFKVFGNGETFTEGKHTLNATMSYDTLITELQSATRDESRPSFRITFPEGTGCLKMAMMLEEAGFCTIEEFLDACNNDVFEVSFYDLISDDPMKFVKIEGFLYPDTYEFYEDETVHNVILTMMQNFEAKVMTDDVMEQISQSGFSLEEAIVFSSIVQKESLPDVAETVAGVFYNRLASPEFDKFESCTTDDFIREVLTPYYGGSLADIPAGMTAAYDTYNYPGLPVGAITNPGIDMILATLNPAQTPYYFFCTNVDTGEFFWAETNAQHEANQVLAGIQ